MSDQPTDLLAVYRAALESIATCPVCERSPCADDCDFARWSVEADDTAAYDMMYAARCALAGGQAVVQYDALQTEPNARG